MAKGTPKPQVVISGTVKVEAQPNPQQTLLLRHRSLPLKQLIKEMNVYSNNDMAEMLADSVGGAAVVQSTAANLARVPQVEIQLINGSGLGPENRISPRAVCAMFMAIQSEASAHQLNLSDLFPMSGFDHRGTVHARHIPLATVIKTGTLQRCECFSRSHAHTRSRFGLVCYYQPWDKCLGFADWTRPTTAKCCKTVTTTSNRSYCPDSPLSNQLFTPARCNQSE